MQSKEPDSAFVRGLVRETRSGSSRINLSGRAPDRWPTRAPYARTCDRRSTGRSPIKPRRSARSTHHRPHRLPGARGPGCSHSPRLTCAMSVSSTLPPVRLNNQAYQNVTNTVVAMSGGPRSNCGMKTSGKCQPVISARAGRRTPRVTTSIAAVAGQSRASPAPLPWARR